MTDHSTEPIIFLFLLVTKTFSLSSIFFFDEVVQRTYIYYIIYIYIYVCVCVSSITVDKNERVRSLKKVVMTARNPIYTGKHHTQVEWVHTIAIFVLSFKHVRHFLLLLLFLLPFSSLYRRRDRCCPRWFLFLIRSYTIARFLFFIPYFVEL